MASRRNQNRNILVKDISLNPVAYLLVLPGVLYTFIFGYLTLPYIIIAFQRFNYKTKILGSEFIGFKNFSFFFSSNSALNVTWNTIKLNFLFILFITVSAMILSLILNELGKTWFVKVSQSLLILPNFLSWVIVSYIVYTFMSTEYGVVNNALKHLGFEPLNWYSDAGKWTAILVLIRMWKFAGINTVIYLSAITGIDEELYDAAYVDGATRYNRIMHITIPLLMPTVCILTLISVGQIFNGDFGMIYSIVGDNGVLFPTTDVIDTYVFRALRKVGDPGIAMAVSVYQSMVGFVLVYGSNRLIRKYFPEGVLF